MNGICPVLDCFFGAIRSGEDGWIAVKVYRDGNPIDLGGGLFDTEEEAEAFAANAHRQELDDNGQGG